MQMNERQAVTMATYGMALFLLVMAMRDPRLWAVDVFKVIIQAMAVSAIGQTILAFHFSGSKTDEVKTTNTAKAFDAITATAKASGTDPDVILKPGEIAQAEGNQDEKA